MDDEFDFLRYLDFGTNPGGPSAAGATSNTFGAYGQGFNSNNAGSSAASSYASPQDRSAGTSEWSVSSPSGSNTSFPKSPLFGSINSIPSLFDSSFSWDPVMNSNNANSKTFNNLNNAPSQPPSMSSGNSPPFDLSIYGSSISSDDLGNANNATNASFNGQQTNGANGFNNMSVNDSVSLVLLAMMLCPPC